MGKICLEFGALNILLIDFISKMGILHPHPAEVNLYFRLNIPQTVYSKNVGNFNSYLDKLRKSYPAAFDFKSTLLLKHPFPADIFYSPIIKHKQQQTIFTENFLYENQEFHNALIALFKGLDCDNVNLNKSKKNNTNSENAVIHDIRQKLVRAIKVNSVQLAKERQEFLTVSIDSKISHVGGPIDNQINTTYMSRFIDLFNILVDINNTMVTAVKNYNSNSDIKNLSNLIIPVTHYLRAQNAILQMIALQTLQKPTTELIQLQKAHREQAAVGFNKAVDENSLEINLLKAANLQYGYYRNYIELRDGVKTFYECLNNKAFSEGTKNFLLRLIEKFYEFQQKHVFNAYTELEHIYNLNEDEIFQEVPHLSNTNYVYKLSTSAYKNQLKDYIHYIYDMMPHLARIVKDPNLKGQNLLYGFQIFEKIEKKLHEFKKHYPLIYNFLYFEKLTETAEIASPSSGANKAKKTSIKNNKIKSTKTIQKTHWKVQENYTENSTGEEIVESTSATSPLIFSALSPVDSTAPQKMDCITEIPPAHEKNATEKTTMVSINFNQYKNNSLQANNKPSRGSRRASQRAKESQNANRETSLIPISEDKTNNPAASLNTLHYSPSRIEMPCHFTYPISMQLLYPAYHSQMLLLQEQKQRHLETAEVLISESDFFITSGEDLAHKVRECRFVEVTVRLGAALEFREHALREIIMLPHHIWYKEINSFIRTHFYQENDSLTLKLKNQLCYIDFYTNQILRSEGNLKSKILLAAPGGNYKERIQTLMKRFDKLQQEVALFANIPFQPLAHNLSYNTAVVPFKKS